MAGEPATGAGGSGPTLSVVVPVMDEEATIEELARRLLEVSKAHRLALVEIVLVDDGSKDGSWKRMAALAASQPRVKALRLRRNFGKATALQAGIAASTGEIVVTMDGDLQDDPEELPRLIAPFKGPVDLVSGWKRNRKDPLSKTLPSRLFNWVTAKASGLPLHDFNCGYKAYRREIFDKVALYGELHRYVPVLAHAMGYAVEEVAIRHQPRRHGRSKYGVGRLAKGLIDLLTVLMLTRFQERPAHLIGGIGLGLGAIGFAILLYLTGLKLLTGADIGNRPLLTLGVMLSIIALQVLFFGILAELIIARSPNGSRTAELIRERVD